MPKKLRKSELDELQNELIQRREQIVKHLAHVDVEKEELQAYHDTQDIASKNDETAEGISEMIADNAILDSYKKSLKDIDQALTLMKKGDYGVCKYCGKEIPIERLKARPTSTSCVDCKSQFTN